MRQPVPRAEIVEERFLAFIVAVCAYLMGRLAVLSAFLKAIHENPRRQRFHLVALLLTVPVFELHNRLFKLVYLGNERRLFLLGRKCELLGGSNLALQFKGHVTDFRSVPQLKKRLGEITRALQ